MNPTTETLKKLDGSTEQIEVPDRKRIAAKKIASRDTVQRVRLADGTLQEVAVTERRTQKSHDRMARRMRNRASGSPTANSDAIPDDVNPAATLDVDFEKGSPAIIDLGADENVGFLSDDEA